MRQKKRKVRRISGVVVAAAGLLIEEAAWNIEFRNNWMNKTCLYGGLGLFVVGLGVALIEPKKRIERGF